ncbi:MAG TPA: DUF3187 family protein [Gemmatimonadales bacterium]
MALHATPGRLRLHGLALLVLGATGSAHSQGLPAYRPINPAITSRSALGFDPVGETRKGWQTAIRVDYGNVLEAQTRSVADYLLDAELSRINLSIGRTQGRWHLQGDLPLESAQSGALDPFITWWHGVFGFDEGRRDERPENQYEYFIQFPDQVRVVRPLPGTSLGDLRISAGYRHGADWMTTLIAAFPTNTRPDGWGLEAVAMGLQTAARRWLVPDRLGWEGSAGLGYSPRAGSLARWQRTWFASASSGLRWRFWGRQSVYSNLLFHTGAWRGTTLQSLDRPDLSLDFGFLLKAGDGPEILAGMVEDLYPFGPAVDLVLRLGVRW